MSVEAEEKQNLVMSEENAYRLVLLAGEHAITLHKQGHDWEFIKRKLSDAVALSITVSGGER